MRGRIESISSVKDRKQIITVVGIVEHNGRLRKYYQITKEGIERINVFIYEWPNVTRAYDFIKGAVKNDE